MSKPIKTEQWKTLKRFPNYAASNLGRIKRISRGTRTKPNLILKGIQSRGYRMVSLFHSGHRTVARVGRLVLEAFVSICPTSCEINHLDGNKANDQLDNLEWCTHLDNMIHASKTRLMNPCKGQSHGRSKLTEDDVKNIRNIWASRKRTQTAIAKQYNVCASTIGRIIDYKRWRHI